jgi:nucleotide-binding universal stress UspA family protein
MFDQVVVPLDGSERAERAIPVAVELATVAGAGVTVLSVVPAPSALEDGREQLEEGIARAGCRGARPEVLVGEPVSSVLLEAIRPGTVVVMSTHARSTVGQLVLGSVADEVVRLSPVPVVLVGPHAGRPVGAYRELLVCVDDDEGVDRLLPLAAGAASDLGIRPWLFQVVEREGDVAHEANLVRRAARELRALGHAPEWEVGHGRDAADAIARFAGDLDAPLIAVSSHGRDPMEGYRERSVTVAVAHRARCPVLVAGPSYVAGWGSDDRPGAVRHVAG